MEQRTEILARRARRLRLRGDFRKAANTYGELTSVEPGEARWWVLSGVMLHHARRDDDADKCFRQALYLMRHRSDRQRAESLRNFLRRSHLPVAA